MIYQIVLVVLLPCHVISQTVSGLYRATQGARHRGNVMQRQQTNEIMTCALLCTRKPQCNWFNFKSRDQVQKGLCELINLLDSSAVVQHDPSWTFCQLVKQPALVPSLPSFSAIFTSLDGSLRLGPVSTRGYTGTPLDGNVTLKNGIQFWTVPYSGMYNIEAYGASGGNGSHSSNGAGWRLGGQGARIKGTFNLNAGTQLKILVGQEGGITGPQLQRPGGGGGGTFVTTSMNIILVIAGGGGGGASIFARCDCRDGDPGQAGHNGTRQGGSMGQGGRRYDKNDGYNPSKLEGSGGGGFNTDGSSSSMVTKGGKSFLGGGEGGNSLAGAALGGFGGGGSGTSYPGGGGGYSGGGVVANGSSLAVAGGGGSYNNGTEQENESGVNKGNGKVVITLIN